jgi:chromosome segregation ATPase
MNEKIQVPFIIFCITVAVFFCIGIWAGFEKGKGTAITRIKELESELSSIQAINKELSEENTEHIETIQRIQELANSSTRSIQLLESGIAELKRIGEAKDFRIIEAERRVRELSEKIGTIESRIDRDAIRITELIEQLRPTSKDNLDRIDSNSSIMWNSNSLNHYKIAEEHRWLRY